MVVQHPLQGSASAIYLGASTPFGVIVGLEAAVYNPSATVIAKDGSRGTWPLAVLIALGARPLVPDVTRPVL